MSVHALASTTAHPATAPSIAARPFLKWAGGKRQLLPVLRGFYPSAFGNYFEPFLGSGAVLFDLFTQQRLDGRSIVLSDHNADLIGCYQMIRTAVEDVIAELQRLQNGHRKDPENHYYRVRDEQFNVERARIASSGSSIDQGYTPRLAAMLIYLNRTGFNGLFRLNSSGGFNVPLGRYANPLICDADNLRRVADLLGHPRVRIVRGSFAAGVIGAEPGDFLYFDPPYAPLSRTASFTAYTADGFSFEDQQQLQQVIISLAARKCHVVLSNSTAPEIEALYDGNPDAHAVGLRAYRVPARRAINSRPDQRGSVMEYVITNVRPS